MGKDTHTEIKCGETAEENSTDRKDQQERVADEGRDPAAEEISEHDHRHIQKIKLKLAVLAAHAGGRLDTDVYYGSKQVARCGQPVTASLVFKLRSFDPLHLEFSNTGVRRLQPK